MRTVNVGLIGFGTVGAGVVRALVEKSHFLARRAGVALKLKSVCVKNTRKKRAVKCDRRILTADVNKILNNPDIDIVVELIGGLHPAKEFIIEALKKGKHIVTANKALLAEEGSSIFKTADRYCRDVYFEASVGGGIPIIKILREGLISNDIDTILGILNGTSNYILTEMKDKGLDFNEALLDAKKRGYAEKEPSLDIEGIDSAHKLAILSLLGFGKAVRLSDIYIEGIQDISINDIRYAGEFGYVIKLLAIAKNVNNQLEVRVHPTLLSQEHLLSNVNGVYNAAYVHGDMIGGQLFYGRGAGGNPTASAVMSDICDLARNISYDITKRVPAFCLNPRIKRLRHINEIESRYYIRFSTIDKPGVLAKIAGILGRHNISIASVSQKERKKARIVPVIIMTHEAKESNMRKALQFIDRLDVIRRKSIAIRIEEPRAR